MKNLYNEDYYENGVEKGISGYENYRWIPELTLPFAKRIVDYLGLKKYDRVLDFGAAKGFMVKALRQNKINAFGCDVSKYAISNCDLEAKPYMMHIKQSTDLIDGLDYDWVLAKDVLEHIPLKELKQVLCDFNTISKNLFVIVPLGDGDRYYVPEYEEDITHIHRSDVGWWVNLFSQYGWNLVKFNVRVEGMKDNWAHYERGNGFFVLRSK